MLFLGHKNSIFQGVRLLFLSNVPGGTFIPEGMFIPSSRARMTQELDMTAPAKIFKSETSRDIKKS